MARLGVCRVGTRGTFHTFNTSPHNPRQILLCNFAAVVSYAASMPSDGVQRAAFTASQKGKLYTAKRAQSEKICKDRKGKKDTVTSGALARAQKTAKAFFRQPPPPPPANEAK